MKKVTFNETVEVFYYSYNNSNLDFGSNSKLKEETDTEYTEYEFHDLISNFFLGFAFVGGFCCVFN